MPVRFQSIRQVASTTEAWQTIVTAVEGQTQVKTGFVYLPGTNRLEVSINGLRQYPGIDYIETNETQIDFTFPLVEGDQVLLRFW